MHKSGFVNIIGKPNVGKSTLLNRFVGEKISIITNKKQTTRHRIHGILNKSNFQIVFSDTPGIIKPSYNLHEKMMKYVDSTFKDADVFLYVTEVTSDPKNFEFNNNYIIEKIKKNFKPTLIVLNKIDNSNQIELESNIMKWQSFFSKAKIFPTSATENFGITEILDEIVSILPFNKPYFPKDYISDKPEKFFVSEIIREKIFLYYDKEIPYSTEVYIESFEEEIKVIKIRSIIFTSKESQKGIIIGNKGFALKKIGHKSRIEIEKFLKKKVFLSIIVKIKKNWRDNNRILENFGYKI